MLYITHTYDWSYYLEGTASIFLFCLIVVVLANLGLVWVSLSCLRGLLWVSQAVHKLETCYMTPKLGKYKDCKGLPWLLVVKCNISDIWVKRVFRLRTSTGHRPLCSELAGEVVLIDAATREARRHCRVIMNHASPHLFHSMACTERDFIVPGLLSEVALYPRYNRNYFGYLT